MRILVLHTGNLGDVVSGMVVVHHLATRPDEVDVYVRPEHRALLRGEKHLRLIGPNLFSRSGPPGANVRVIEKDFPCRPCNQNRPCPYARRCLAAITLEDLKALLSGWVDP